MAPVFARSFDCSASRMKCVVVGWDESDAREVERA